VLTFKQVLEKYGNLNPVSFEKYSLKLDIDNQFNHLFVIQQAIDRIYEMSLEDQEGGPYYAICLASLENPTGKLANKFQFNKSVVQVIARIPKLHGAIPKPHDLGCLGYNIAAINMHPTFYAETTTSTPLPKPGNIIKVDISSADPKYGEYLGLVDSSVTVESCAELFASKSVENPEAVHQLLSDVTNGDSNGQ